MVNVNLKANDRVTGSLGSLIRRSLFDTLIAYMESMILSSLVIA